MSWQIICHGLHRMGAASAFIRKEFDSWEVYVGGDRVCGCKTWKKGRDKAENEVLERYGYKGGNEAGKQGNEQRLLPGFKDTP